MFASPAGASPWQFHLHLDVWLLMGGLLIGYMTAVGWWGPRVVPPGAAAASTKQKALFVAGVLTLWVGADWPIHDLSENFLFSVHMTQHMLFSFIAPPLILMGIPKWLLRKLLGQGALMRAVRVLTRPIVALVLFNAFVAVSHWPDLVDLALRVEIVHFVVHVLLVTTSLLMWWPVVDPLPEMARLSTPAKMVYLFLQSIIPTVPASFLTFSSGVVYEFYASVPHPWIDAVADQQIAGLIMKLGGGALLWGLITVMFFKWIAHEKEDDREVDEIEWEDFERELRAWDLRKS